RPCVRSPLRYSWRKGVVHEGTSRRGKRKPTLAYRLGGVPKRFLNVLEFQVWVRLRDLGVTHTVGDHGNDRDGHTEPLMQGTPTIWPGSIGSPWSTPASNATAMLGTNSQWVRNSHRP